MPAMQRGQAYRLERNRWGLRYYDRDGMRRRTDEKFPSKSAALAHYREVIEPMLNGATSRPELTFNELADLFLERHARNVRPRTIATLADRLKHARKAYGDELLSDLERMVDELAGWQATLPPRAGHGIAQALRQCLDAASTPPCAGST